MMVQICEAGRDPCGCDQWKKGIRTINNQYPDDNRDFDINAGDGIEITPATAGITIAVKTPFPGPMIFRGTVGTGGTIASLPAANANNLGWMYVAITAGSTPDDTPKPYDIGDELISNGAEWIVVPSGDDPVDWSQIQNKPTTLSGYGITDAVNTTGDQTGIAGAKTWTGVQKITADNNTLGLIMKSSNIKRSDNVGGFTRLNQLQLQDMNGDTTGYIQNYLDGTGYLITNYGTSSPSGTNRELRIASGTSDGYATVPYRAYNSSNVNDIVTIGSLASNPSVVHTTGNETVAGYKTFSAGAIYTLDTNHKMIGSNESTKNNTHVSTVSPDGTTEIRMTVIANDGGTGSISISKFINGSYVSSSTVASI